VLTPLSVLELERVWSAYDCDVWDCGDILSELGVLRAIEDGRLTPPSEAFIGPQHIGHHESRVAWLVVHGWRDPIEVDFGAPALWNTNWWAITDGNHRLAAAIYRGEKSIVADCAGDEEEIRRFAYGAVNLNETIYD
jgi:hypothetical protein